MFLTVQVEDAAAEFERLKGGGLAIAMSSSRSIRSQDSGTSTSDKNARRPNKGGSH
jgi:hypothetical protein